MLIQLPDEVARIGALSNGSNGQRSSESASLHFGKLLSRSGRRRLKEADDGIVTGKVIRCRAQFESPTDFASMVDRPISQMLVARPQCRTLCYHAIVRFSRNPANFRRQLKEKQFVVAER
jgi:hypothetical protein